MFLLRSLEHFALTVSCLVLTAPCLFFSCVLQVAVDEAAMAPTPPTSRTPPSSPRWAIKASRPASTNPKQLSDCYRPSTFPSRPYQTKPTLLSSLLSVTRLLKLCDARGLVERAPCAVNLFVAKPTSDDRQLCGPKSPRRVVQALRAIVRDGERSLHKL